MTGSWHFLSSYKIWSVFLFGQAGQKNMKRPIYRPMPERKAAPFRVASKGVYTDGGSITESPEMCKFGGIWSYLPLVQPSETCAYHRSGSALSTAGDAVCSYTQPGWSRIGWKFRRRDRQQRRMLRKHRTLVNSANQFILD